MCVAVELSLIEDIVLYFMGIEHILLFLFDLVLDSDGGIFHNSNDILIIFGLQKLFFLSPI